jgi:hypothetical protein
MKVKELIEKLQQFNTEKEIYIYNDDYSDIFSVKEDFVINNLQQKENCIVISTE